MDKEFEHSNKSDRIFGYGSQAFYNLHIQVIQNNFKQTDVIQITNDSSVYIEVNQW